MRVNYFRAKGASWFLASRKTVVPFRDKRRVTGDTIHAQQLSVQVMGRMPLCISGSAEGGQNGLTTRITVQ